MVFLIDLPRLAKHVDHQPTTFSTELGRFLEATGVDENMTNSLTNYDFSRTKHLRFVYTMYARSREEKKTPFPSPHALTLSSPGGHLNESHKRVGELSRVLHKLVGRQLTSYLKDTAD